MSEVHLKLIVSDDLSRHNKGHAKAATAAHVKLTRL